MPFAKLDKGFNRSSIMLEEPMVRLVFLHMLAECDFNGEIEMGPAMMAKNFSIPMDDVKNALERLSAPDPESRSPNHDGRRILPLGDGLVGWRLVNYVAYRDARDDDARRRYKREWQAEKRRQEREEGQDEDREGQVRTPVDTCGQVGTREDTVDRSEEDLEGDGDQKKKKDVADPPDRTTVREVKKGPPRKKTARQVEIDWRIERVYARMCHRRRHILENRGGVAPGRPPALTPGLRRAIADSLKDYDPELLGADQRDQWERDSIVAASGEGLWLSPWHNGSDPETKGKRYTEPMRAFSKFRAQGGHGCETFPEIYFAAREFHERRQERAREANLRRREEP